MKKENILFAIVGIFAGFFAGFYLANSLNKRETSQQNASLARNAATNPPFLNGQTQAADIKPSQPAQGKPLPEVAEKLDKATSEPNNFDVQMQAGNLYLQIKGMDKAREFFDRAARLNPKEYENFVKLGDAYFDIGQFEQAEKWYLEALNKKPEDLNVRTDLGITFVERETPDYDRAVKEFQTALETNPEFEPALYNLGIAYAKKGEAAQTEKIIAQLEEINPQGRLAERLRQAVSQK